MWGVVLGEREGGSGNRRKKVSLSLDTTSHCKPLSCVGGEESVCRRGKKSVVPLQHFEKRKASLKGSSIRVARSSRSKTKIRALEGTDLDMGERRIKPRIRDRSRRFRDERVDLNIDYLHHRGKTIWHREGGSLK